MLIALDIGNVSVQLHLEESNRMFGFSGSYPPAFEAIAEQYETGKIQTPEFLKKASAVTGLSEQVVYDAWDMKVGCEIPGMGDAVREFAAKGVEFAFLSDIGELHLAKVRRSVSFVNLCKGGIFSHEAGIRKPNAGIYQAFEETYGKPDLFFDDMEKNVIGAVAMGWKAVRFTGVNMFRETVNQLLSGRL